jgi:hypothetical protein
MPTLGKQLFGPDWPGQRCGAIARSGVQCKNPAVTGRKRCRSHGGKAGAPKGERNGNYRHGEFTKQAIERHRQDRAKLTEMAKLARKLGLI